LAWWATRLAGNDLDQVCRTLREHHLREDQDADATHCGRVWLQPVLRIGQTFLIRILVDLHLEGRGDPANGDLGRKARVSSVFLPPGKKFPRSLDELGDRI
jgi:hypothetical protein